jgi:peptidase E
MFLFIPTASKDNEGYRNVVEEHFGSRVGYKQIQHITLHLRDYTKQELIDIINRADVIYVGGGNTAMMMDKRNQTGLTEILRESYTQSSHNKVFC